MNYHPNLVQFGVLSDGQLGVDLPHFRRLRRLPNNAPGVSYKRRVHQIYKYSERYYIAPDERSFLESESPADGTLTFDDISSRSLNGAFVTQPERTAETGIGRSRQISASVVRPSESEELTNFAIEIQQDILDKSLSDIPREIDCTTVLLEYLLESEEIDDYVQIDYSTRGARLDAYAFNEEEQRVDVFATLHLDTPPLVTAEKSRVEGRIKSVMSLLDRCIPGIPPLASEHPELLGFVRNFRDLLAREQVLIRLFLITDGVSTLDTYAASTNTHYSVNVQLWDLRRFYRRRLSSWIPEPINVDFEDLGGDPIRVVHSNANAEFRTLIAIIPGRTLSDLYERHGQRLLEGNVRSYLQNRGKINQGILNTIQLEPQRFLTYNNGISVVANGATTTTDSEGGEWLNSCNGFQIVNGAQTTASLHRAVKHEKYDISAVNVQAKITVVPADQAQIITPLISAYSNTQNKIQTSDFSANDPFHRKIETLSRRIWTSPSGAGQLGSLWFYERARGQYADSLFRARTPADKRRFKNENPSRQKFSKTDLAKYLHSWQGMPEVVSLGAQKNFRHFVQNSQASMSLESLDEAFYRKLIGMAILFRGIDSIVRRQGLSGYKANVVTYTMACIARTHPDDRLIEQLWVHQELPANLAREIDDLSLRIRHKLIESADGKNVTEYSKASEAWYIIKTQIA